MLVLDIPIMLSYSETVKLKKTKKKENTDTKLEHNLQLCSRTCKG